MSAVLDLAVKVLNYCAFSPFTQNMRGSEIKAKVSELFGEELTNQAVEVVTGKVQPVSRSSNSSSPMKVYLLFAQRKCNYPGEYAPEVLAAVSEEVLLDDNSEFLKDKIEEYRVTNEFDSVQFGAVMIPDNEVKKLLHSIPVLDSGMVSPEETPE